MSERIKEIDLLRGLLGNERVARALAHLELEKQKLETLRLELSILYSLGPKDSVDWGTGIIVRAPTVEGQQ